MKIKFISTVFLAITLVSLLAACTKAPSAPQNGVNDTAEQADVSDDTASGEYETDTYFRKPVISRETLLNAVYFTQGDRIYTPSRYENREALLSIIADTAEKMSSCYIATCTHDNADCPLYIKDLSDYNLIAVHEKEKGTDIYIVARTSYEKNSVLTTGTQVYRYDMSTGKKTHILRDWSNGVVSDIILWRDHIYLKTRDAMYGANEMFRMKPDGSDLKKIRSFGNAAMVSLLGVDRDYMYIFTRPDNTVYRANEDFSVLEECNFTGINTEKLKLYKDVYRGYLYYVEDGGSFKERDEEIPSVYNWSEHKYDDTFSYSNYILRRVKLDSPDSEPEIVLERTHIITNLVFDGDRLYAGYTDHYLFGDFERTDDDGSVHTSYRINWQCGIQMVNLNTLETNIVFTKSLYHIETILYASAEKVYFYGYDKKASFENKVGGDFNYYVYDCKTGTYEAIFVDPYADMKQEILDKINGIK